MFIEFGEINVDDLQRILADETAMIADIDTIQDTPKPEERNLIIFTQDNSSHGMMGKVMDIARAAKIKNVSIARY